MIQRMVGQSREPNPPRVADALVRGARRARERAAAVFYDVATLFDGAKVILRTLRPDDYHAVTALAEALTDRERYFRFFTQHPSYIGEWARSLTRSRPGSVALGAFENDDLIGVAGYVESRLSGYAEIAVVVAHHHHDRGVGTALLRALGHIARANGQHHFVADVLAENQAMRKLLADAGWPLTTHLDGTVLSVEIDLDHADDEHRDATSKSRPYPGDR